MKKLMILSSALLIALISYLNCDADAWIERASFDSPKIVTREFANDDAASNCPLARMDRARQRPTESVQIAVPHKDVQLSTPSEIISPPKKAPIARLSRKAQIVRPRARIRMAKAGRRMHVARVHKKTHIAGSHNRRRSISGIASWYGGKFLGRKTASGARFVAHKMTAAHKHLPFGTKLLVRNRKNGRTAVVTVNDRGPFIKDRVLDLSPAAAHELGMLSSGITPVVATIISDS